MILLLWDASALAQRYAPAPGHSTDASILAAFLKYAGQQLPTTACVLLAADQRLLRAAQAEGLKTLNPERITDADVPAFLAAL
ncbi:MAG: hypothetical protein L0Z62_40495 [Gemmataceae bacterium]|nr:hypothetical protein [Gemmataceae bacterium]